MAKNWPAESGIDYGRPNPPAWDRDALVAFPFLRGSSLLAGDSSPSPNTHGLYTVERWPTATTTTINTEFSNRQIKR
jgi:hypothetical protein